MAFRRAALGLGLAATSCEAFPSYWHSKRGECRAPTAEDLIMGNNPAVAAMESELALEGQTLSVSTAASAHLIVASDGIFSNPSTGGQILCDGKMIAWDSKATSRSLTWTAPAGATITLGTAAGYGPLSLYTMTTAAEATTTTEAAAETTEMTTQSPTTEAAAETTEMATQSPTTEAAAETTEMATQSPTTEAAAETTEMATVITTKMETAVMTETTAMMETTQVSLPETTIDVMVTTAEPVSTSMLIETTPAPDDQTPDGATSGASLLSVTAPVCTALVMAALCAF